MTPVRGCVRDGTMADAKHFFRYRARQKGGCQAADAFEESIEEPQVPEGW